MPTGKPKDNASNGQPRAFRTPRPGRWLPGARAGWILAAALSLLLWLQGTYANATQPLPVCAGAPCDPFSLSAEDMLVVQALGLPRGLVLGFWLATNLLTGLPFFAVAGVLFWRKSNDWVGLLVSFSLVFLGSLLFTDSDDALWRTYATARAPLAILYSLGWTALLLLWFYFPDGKFVPGWRGARPAVILLALINLPYFASAVRGISFGSLLVVATMGLGLAAQGYRYFRVAGPIQQQQTKWVVLGMFAAVTVMLIWMYTGLAFPPGRSGPERISSLFVIRAAIVALISALPLTIAFSILRYRLWDIDLIIRRTLVYSVLTAALAGVYFGGVVLLQALVRSVTGQTSQLGVVTSTLAIAALFNPLRRRVQDFIDRRFYRRRYDAARALAEFSATARDETDLDRLAARLVGVVEETMQPAHASLWLKPTADALRNER